LGREATVRSVLHFIFIKKKKIARQRKTGKKCFRDLFQKQPRARPKKYKAWQGEQARWQNMQCRGHTGIKGLRQQTQFSDRQRDSRKNYCDFQPQK